MDHGSRSRPGGLFLRDKDYLITVNMRDLKCWEKAKSRSFYARDNVCNFIKWCRFLQVREAVIFESEDLVLHNNQRNVVLCLLEVARIACTKYGFGPTPGLVQLEQEIDKEIEKEENAGEEEKENGGVEDKRKGGGPPAPRCPEKSRQSSSPFENDALLQAAASAAVSSDDAGCWSSEGALSSTPSSPDRRSPSAASQVSSASLGSVNSSLSDASLLVSNNNNNSSKQSNANCIAASQQQALLISQLDQKVSNRLSL